MTEPTSSLNLSEIVIPICTFILGFVVSRFTMSKAERKAHEMAAQKLSNELIEMKKERYDAFIAAMKAYAEKDDEPTLDDFCDIAQKGEAYFTSMIAICDSILSANIPKSTIINTHAPGIAEVMEKSLPSFYATLQEIARKKGISYKGKLNRSQYESIFKVYEKYIDKIEPT